MARRRRSTRYRTVLVKDAGHWVHHDQLRRSWTSSGSSCARTTRRPPATQQRQRAAERLGVDRRGRRIVVERQRDHRGVVPRQARHSTARGRLRPLLAHVHVRALGMHFQTQHRVRRPDAHLAHWPGVRRRAARNVSVTPRVRSYSVASMRSGLLSRSASESPSRETSQPASSSASLLSAAPPLSSRSTVICEKLLQLLRHRRTGRSAPATSPCVPMRGPTAPGRTAAGAQHMVEARPSSASPAVSKKTRSAVSMSSRPCGRRASGASISQRHTGSSGTSRPSTADEAPAAGPRAARQPHFLGATCGRRRRAPAARRDRASRSSVRREASARIARHGCVAAAAASRVEARHRPPRRARTRRS